MPRYLDLFTNFGFKSDIIEDAFSLSKLAKKLLDILDDETISLKTGLTKDEVKELRL